MPRRPLLGLSLLSLAAAPLLSQGCSPATRVGRKILAGERPGVYAPEVPTERQATGGSCGANALASILRFHGMAASQRELDRVLYVESIRGALTVDLWREARRRGLSAWESTRLSERDLRAMVAARVPPIVLIRKERRGKPLDHFLVLTGFDEASERWIVQEGLGLETFLPAEELRARWSSLGRWALLAAPAGTEGAFRAWSAAQPADWRPWNNLADLFADRGRPAEGKEALARAVALAGDDPAAKPYLADTRSKLERAQVPPPR